MVKEGRFSPPHLGTNMVRRKAVLEQMDEYSSKGILFIHAPIGYGKTTAVLQWLRGKRGAWFALDEYSASPAAFFGGILTALSGKGTAGIVDKPLEDTLEALQRLKRWPDALVIDNFHLCSHPAIARALPLLRARMPLRTAFIILSRTPPAQLMDEQILNGSMIVLSSLAFSEGEIQSLFQKHGVNISKQEAGALKKRTDGWAAALSAVLLSGVSDRDFVGMIKQKEYLYRYLRNIIFENGSYDSILKKCSICDRMDARLCESITGESRGIEMISDLANRTGLVSRLEGNTYCFHELLKEWLESELQLDNTIDKPSLYKSAAKYYREQGDWFCMLDMAVKNGDIETIEEFSRVTGKESDAFGVDIEKYSRFVEENLLSIPKHISQQYFRISAHCYLASFLSRNILEVHEWGDVIEGYAQRGDIRLTDHVLAAFLLAIDPRKCSWYAVKQFERLERILPKGVRARMMTLTHNCPYFHKAQRDYTDISPTLFEFMEEAKRYMPPVIGSAYEPLALLVEAGILYEQGRFEETEAIAERAVILTEHSLAEIAFAALALYYEVLRIQGKLIRPEQIETMLEHTNAHVLFINYKAYSTMIRLFCGDKEAARLWLENSKIEGRLKFYKLYQYIVTARSLMVARRLQEAEKLLGRLAVFSKEYRRSADYMEILTLRGICLWNMKHAEEALKTIIPAILEGERLQLLTPIAKEGKDVMPLLQRIVNRLKLGYDSELLNRPYVSTLLMKAQEISEKIPGMLVNHELRPVRLSAKQYELLNYLAQGFSQREIAEHMEVKLTTIKDYAKKIHEKLGVSNSQEALQRARELGIWNTHERRML